MPLIVKCYIIHLNHPVNWSKTFLIARLFNSQKTKKLIRRKYSQNVNNQLFGYIF